MCSERRWPADEWRSYLMVHPIVGPLCSRMLWLRHRADATTGFRPMGDGTLTDVGDNEIELQDTDLVQLMHGSLVADDTAERWREHLADFEIEPAIEQFPAALADLPDDLATATSLTSCEGWMIRTFELRGRAAKRGYQRGQGEDGGWFYTYSKSFPSLRLDAVLEFSGNSLPEEDRDAALRSLSFTPAEAGYGAQPRPLKDVPAVLLAEARADLAFFMAGSSGYDPDWEDKIEM